MNLEFVDAPPMGFSFVTMDELPWNPIRWFIRARENGSSKNFVISRDANGWYVLWVRKNKNDKAGRVGWRTVFVNGQG